MTLLTDHRTRVGALDVAWTGSPSLPGAEPLFLLHGNWSSRVWWERVIDHLPPQIRAIAPDMRGRGDTRGPDSNYSIASLADDLIALADALGIPGFHVAGHSLGSAVAMECALRYPARVRSVAAISPAWVDGLPALYNQAAHQRAYTDRGALERALVQLSPSAPRDDFWRRCVDAGHRQRMTAALRNLDALLAFKPGDELGSITAPRLVLTGALDGLTGGAVALRAAQALKTDLVVIPSIGHCVPVEAPERCAHELARLVNAAPR